MSARLNYYRIAPDVMKAMGALEEATKPLSIPLALRELIKMRVSQINACAYCLNLHAPAARAAGISQQKLDVLSAWRESPAFDERERAALAWARRPSAHSSAAFWPPATSTFLPRWPVTASLPSSIGSWPEM